MSAVTSPYGPGKTRSKDGRFPASESLRNLLAPRPSDGIVAKRQATVTGHVTDSSRGMRESRAGGGRGRRNRARLLWRSTGLRDRAKDSSYARRARARERAE